MIPHAVPGRWPVGIAESRLAARVRVEPAGCRVAILGMPDDLGVRMNGGRPGAAGGPRAFREALSRYGAAEPAGRPYPMVFDAGDVVPAEGDSEAALEETHARVTAAARAVCEMGMLPVGIGGGHDLTFAFVRGVMQKFGPMSGIYFDAHLDVRETAGSGMPMRKLVEECGVKVLHVHGLNPLVNTREHGEWFERNGGRVRNARPQGRDLAIDDRGDDDVPPGNVFASFDMDVLDGSVAPGVSAVNPCGWDVARAAGWVDAVGLSPRVKCMDFMELNPAFDVDGRTARVMAHLFLVFLRAFAERRG